MSTNDAVVLMASGASGVQPDCDQFAKAVRDLCHDLAQQLLRDAEGSEHDIAITVRGAADEADALEVARSVARSNLFKCAIFGKDPNWGRILASVGTTAATFDPQDLDVALNGVWVCRNSGVGEDRDLVDLTARDVTVEIDLKSGHGRGDDLDQRPDPRLCARELGVRVMSRDLTAALEKAATLTEALAVAGAVPRQDRRDQVRRQRDGRRQAQAGVRRGHRVPAVRRHPARRRARWRTADQQHARPTRHRVGVPRRTAGDVAGGDGRGPDGARRPGRS